jgi:hypothetical protein
MIQDQQLRPPLRLDRGAAPRASALASTRERGDGPMRGRRRRGLTNSFVKQTGDTKNSDSSAVVRSELPPGNSRSLPYGPTRGGPWMWRLEAIQASSHDAVDGVAPTVRNSHQTNPRLPSRAELIMLGVIGTPRRNVLGAIAMKRTIATSRCNDNRDEFHYEQKPSPTISSTKKAKIAQRYQCATPSIETALT